MIEIAPKTAKIALRARLAAPYVRFDQRYSHRANSP
jgi:hypothetical protein